MPDERVRLAVDLLRGADEIAEFVFGDPSQRRRVYYRASEAKPGDRLPLFKIGSEICGRRSTLLRCVEEQEKRARGEAA